MAGSPEIIRIYRKVEEWQHQLCIIRWWLWLLVCRVDWREQGWKPGDPWGGSSQKRVHNPLDGVGVDKIGIKETTSTPLVLPLSPFYVLGQVLVFGSVSPGASLPHLPRLGTWWPVVSVCWDWGVSWCVWLCVLISPQNTSHSFPARNLNLKPTSSLLAQLTPVHQSGFSGNVTSLLCSVEVSVYPICSWFYSSIFEWGREGVLRGRNMSSGARMPGFSTWQQLLLCDVGQVTYPPWASSFPISTKG